MSLLGIGGGGMFSLVAEVGLAAVTGGTSMAIEVAAQQVLKAAVGESLQIVGQQLGLSSDEIGAVLDATGFGGLGRASDQASSVGQQLGFSPMEQGQIGADAQKTTDAFTQMFQQAIEGAGGESRAQGKTGGRSLLQAIAYAMGKAMDAKLDDMAKKAQQLGDAKSGSSEYGQLSSEISADGQELGMMSSAVSNAIKSIGEAGSALARKQ